MDPLDSVIDILEKNITAKKAESSDGEEIFVPKKCAYCKNNVICSVLQTFIGISRIGIMIGVEKCQFNTPVEASQITKDQ